MLNRRKPKASTKRRTVILVGGICALLLWVVFVVVQFSYLPGGRESTAHVNTPKHTGNVRSVDDLDINFSAQKMNRVAYDKDYLKIIGGVCKGETEPFGTSSERNVSGQPIDIVLDVNDFNTKPGSVGLYSMLVMFFLRSIEKYFVFFNPHGKIRVLLPVKDENAFSEWQNGKVVVVGYDEIFPSPDNNLPTSNPNAVKANLRSIPGISNNFVFFEKFTFLKDFLSVSKFLTLDGKIKIYLKDKKHEKKEDEGKPTSYVSLIETNRIMKSAFDSKSTSDKAKNRHNKKRKEDRVIKGSNGEAKYSVYNYLPSDITFFRKPVLDYMYDMWSHEFVKASNSRHQSRKEFDILFGYVNMLTKEDIGVSVNQDEEIERKNYVWGTNNGNNVKYETEISKSGKGKGDYFTLTIGKGVNEKSKEISHLQRVLCMLYPEKSSFERLDTINPCDNL